MTVNKPEEEPARILIVEDEPELAELLEGFLKRHGFSTRIAGDGLTACRMTEEFRPHLILLDILLPELDGWEVCRLIRRVPDRSLAGTPIIMVSALHSLEDRKKGLELGAEDYIPKPYSFRDLICRARQIIERHQ
jgi:DNA-binding response OmpR family regulator